MSSIPECKDGAHAPEPPLFVDLDGTLIKGDLLVESFFVLARMSPLHALMAPIWLLRGKAYLKQRIAERVDLDPAELPYSQGFVEFLREQATRNRRLFLATASDISLARVVAAHLGFFSGVVASDGQWNMKGSRKLEAIAAAAEGGPFDYAGNGCVDLAVWSSARKAILVNPDRGVERAAAKITEVDRVFEDRRRGLRTYLKAMRVHQWLKNLLVFVPLLTAHAWGDTSAIVRSLIAFFAFGLCASAIYLINDLLDLPADRSHPRKRNRPLAAGDLPLTRGLALVPVLLASGVGLATRLPNEFLASLLLYLAFSIAYAVHLKTYVLIDVMLLAVLYTLRVIGGAFAIEAPPSFWLLAFSMFIFLSLSLIKRCAELINLAVLGRLQAPGRDYHSHDIEFLASMGMASGYVAILVLALFISDTDVASHYNYPQGLWILCPLILYWISRLWLKTGRGEMHDDPIIFTLKDRGSRYVIAACVVVIVVSTRLPG